MNDTNMRKKMLGAWKLIKILKVAKNVLVSFWNLSVVQKKAEWVTANWFLVKCACKQNAPYHYTENFSYIF